jgi:hypothetical protein
MTEAEWLEYGNPEAMLAFLRTSDTLSERKARLFAAASCRRIWDVVDSDNRRLGEAIERYADGNAAAAEMQAMAEEAHDNDWTAAMAFEEAASDEIIEAAEHAAGNAAHAYAEHVHGYPPPSLGPDGVFRWTDPAFVATREAEYRLQADMIRDIFGPLPFRPIRIDPAWLAWNNGAVRKMAEAIYEQRKQPSGHLDHARLGVLADALEEAGCADGDMLSHLRQPEAVHVRGCWVIDLVLNKA